MTPAPPSALTPESAASILTNRTALALAKSQRLIASWLPPPSSSSSPPDSSNPNPNLETEDDDDDIFTPVPELLGIGATVPTTDGAARREEMSGNERLRRQLLGRDFVAKGKRVVDGKRGGGGARVVGMGMGIGMGERGGKLRAAPPPPTRREGHGDGDGDGDGDSKDEGGRSSLGKLKRGKRKRQEERASGPVVEDSVGSGEDKAAAGGSEARRRLGKRAGNYLDEVLADRLRKKGKKRKKKKEGVVDS